MYYKQSKEISKYIQSARSILLNVHPNADLDAVGSTTATASVLRTMGKEVMMVSPHVIEKKFLFLHGASKIKKIDFATFDFSGFDLFITLDVSSFDRVTGSKTINLPHGLPRVVIDHHLNNSITGEIKLVEETAAATSEILYGLFSDWKINITPDIATSLYAGIAGDTVFFRYMSNSLKTMSVATELIRLGSDREKVVSEFYQKYSLDFIKMLGKFLQLMKLGKNKSGRKFVWAAVPYSEYVEYGKPKGVKDAAADFYFQSVDSAEFGIALLEAERGEVSVSFRSRGKCDVSILARALGGGGHRNAAGTTLFCNYMEAVKKVLDTASDVKI